MSGLIHPSSVIDPSARLAEGVIVGPFCMIGPNVTIGEDTKLVSHVIVESHTRIGRDNVICASSLGGTPQDRKHSGEVTWCEIGDRNQIREYVTIHRGTRNGGDITRVGSDNLIMAGAHIAHDCVVGNNVTIANNTMLAGHVNVADWATIGGGAGLHHYVSIGRMAFVAAMARVERDAPPFMTIEGYPARVRVPNEILLQRRCMPEEVIRALRTGCRRMFARRTQGEATSFTERLESLLSEFGEFAEIREFCEAVGQINACANGRVREQARPDDKRKTVLRTGA